MAFSESRFREIISGDARDGVARLLRPMLRAASWPYGTAAALRRAAYRRGWRRSCQAGVPVVSVGNITTGGTGKTPLVAWVVGQLGRQGRRPAVLIRGYRGRDGKSDEAELLERLTGAPVIVDPDRLAGAARAVAGGADVLVMDDGFQHLRLRRDLDIVTIDATCPFGHDALLPRGLLRESPAVLALADMLVLTRCDQVSQSQLLSLRKRLARLAPGVTVAETIIRPTRILGHDAAPLPAEALAARAVWAFCGLGNPENFYRTLTGLGARLLGQTTFNDHHAYVPADVEALAARADAAGAELLLTTAKDAVKLHGLAAQVRWLEIELEFRTGRQELEDRLRQQATGAAR